MFNLKKKRFCYTLKRFLKENTHIIIKLKPIFVSYTKKINNTNTYLAIFYFNNAIPVIVLILNERNKITFNSS